MDSSPPGFSVHGDSPGKNTGVGCHALLQGIFPTQGLNPVFPHCRRIPYHLSHQGSPISALSPPPRTPGHTGTPLGSSVPSDVLNFKLTKSPKLFYNLIFF